eukprot:g3594.t1
MAPAAAALDVEATAPLVSPEQLKKPLKFAWDQSDQFVKVYVDVDVSIDSTDQNDGSSVSVPAADDISLETPDDWTAILSESEDTRPDSFQLGLVFNFTSRKKRKIQDDTIPVVPACADDLASTKLPDDRNSSKASSDDVAGGATAKDNDADKKSDASDQDASFLKLGRRVADEMSGRAKQPCTSTSMSLAEDTVMRRIFIGGLPHTVTEVDVEAQFQRFGEITDIAIKRKGADGSSNPFAFVTFSDGAAAGAAVSEMNRSQSFGDGGEILVQHQREGKGSGGKGGFSSSFNGKIVSSSKSGALGFSGGGLAIGASAGSSTKQDPEQVEEQPEKAAAPKAKGKEPYGGGTNYPKKGGGRERMRSGRSRSPGGLNRSGGRRDRGRVAPRTAAPSSSKLQSDCDPTAVYLNGKKFFPGYSTGLGFFDTPAIREGGMRVNGMMNAADEESDGDPSVYKGEATLTYNSGGGCVRDFYSIGGGEGASNRDLRQGVRDKAAAPHVVEAFRALLRGDFGRAAGAAGIHNFIQHKGAGKAVAELLTRASCSSPGRWREPTRDGPPRESTPLRVVVAELLASLVKVAIAQCPRRCPARGSPCWNHRPATKSKFLAEGAAGTSKSATATNSFTNGVSKSTTTTSDELVVDQVRSATTREGEPVAEVKNVKNKTKGARAGAGGDAGIVATTAKGKEKEKGKDDEKRVDDEGATSKKTKKAKNNKKRARIDSRNDSSADAAPEQSRREAAGASKSRTAAPPATKKTKSGGSSCAASATAGKKKVKKETKEAAKATKKGKAENPATATSTSAVAATTNTKSKRSETSRTTRTASSSKIVAHKKYVVEIRNLPSEMLGGKADLKALAKNYTPDPAVVLKASIEKGEGGISRGIVVLACLDAATHLVKKLDNKKVKGKTEVRLQAKLVNDEKAGSD